MAFTDLSRAWRGPAHPTPQGGLLLVHGFTGSPQSLRPWGEDHAAHGWDVRIPLLPGHGTTWQDMSRTRWQDWSGEVARAAAELIAEHGRISVGALSMGGALALALAEDPVLAARIDALVLVNPAVILPRSQRLAIPLLSRVIASIPGVASDIALPGAVEEGYDRSPLRSVEQMRRLQRRVRAGLPEVTAPLLLATSAADHVVDPRSSDLVASRVRGPVERLALIRSYHVATLDHDAPLLFAASARFLAEHRGG